MSEPVLVTGGAGFLGSHLCERLLAAGHKVFCLDNFSSGRKNNITHLLDNPAFETLDQDIRMEASLPPVAYICHLASRASPSDFTAFPVEIALTNTLGTRRLLDHARACDATLVFTSTSEVYGDPKVHPQTETYNGNVNVRGLRGCYDESKRFAETLIESYRREYGLDARTARVFNTYGPRMRPDDGRVVPTFISQALRAEDLTVYGDGTQTRSFCYVSDLIGGLLSLLQASDPQYGVYNLGKENERRIVDLAEEVLDTVESPSEITYEPLPEDDPKQRKPDISRAVSDLNWEPTVSLREGLAETIPYFRSTI